VLGNFVQEIAPDEFRPLVDLLVETCQRREFLETYYLRKSDKMLSGSFLLLNTLCRS